MSSVLHFSEVFVFIGWGEEISQENESKSLTFSFITFLEIGLIVSICVRERLQ